MIPKTATALGADPGVDHTDILGELQREALQYGIPEATVQSLYQAELANLTATAHPQDVILGLVTRRLRSAFRRVHSLYKP